MADKYQTQCPHCGVKFQITAQQLSLANGAVRCGACLQVFQANQHLVPLSATPPPPGVASARPVPPPAAAPARPAAAVPPRPVPPPAPEPDAVADDDLADMILRELEESPARPAAPAAAPVAPAPTAAAPAATPAPARAPTADHQPPPAADAPQWTLPTEQPAAGADDNRTRIAIGAEIDDELLSLDDPFGAGASSSAHLNAAPANSAAADESWAKALLGEGLSDKEDRVSKFIGVTADKLSLAQEEKTGMAGRLDQLARGETVAAGGKGSAGDALLDDELDFLNSDSLTLHDVELPPLDADAGLAHGGSHDVAWNRDIFWGTISAVFALVLAGQYLVFNFDTLSRDDGWRGFYATACDALGCTLPTRSDVTRIQGANLVVRSHPSAAQALVVDAIIYNRAPFTQPFPDLELSFSDTHGNVVAGRVFKPAEYLKGDLAGAESMPPDTPVHLTLELADPGTQASGYALRFLPPAAS